MSLGSRSQLSCLNILQGFPFYYMVHQALVCLICFFTSHQQSFSYMETDFPELNQYYARINVSCSRTQRSDAGEARTRGPSVRVKHYTTEPLPSLHQALDIYIYKYMNIYEKQITGIYKPVHQILVPITLANNKGRGQKYFNIALVLKDK